MGELECNNFELQDQVQSLEEQLRSTKSSLLPVVTEEHEDVDPPSELLCPETLQAKDKYIAQLEKETEAVKAEIRKLVRA